MPCTQTHNQQVYTKYGAAREWDLEATSFHTFSLLSKHLHGPLVRYSPQASPSVIQSENQLKNPVTS